MNLLLGAVAIEFGLVKLCSVHVLVVCKNWNRSVHKQRKRHKEPPTETDSGFDMCQDANRLYILVVARGARPKRHF
jgi:hypothetical protein